MKTKCDYCPYGRIDWWGNRFCNYPNISRSEPCVQDIIEYENREYPESIYYEGDKNE